MASFEPVWPATCVPLERALPRVDDLWIVEAVLTTSGATLGEVTGRAYDTLPIGVQTRGFRYAKTYVGRSLHMLCEHARAKKIPSLPPMFVTVPPVVGRKTRRARRRLARERMQWSEMQAEAEAEAGAEEGEGEDELEEVWSDMPAPAQGDAQASNDTGLTTVSPPLRRTSISPALLELLDQRLGRKHDKIQDWSTEEEKQAVEVAVPDTEYNRDEALYIAARNNYILSTQTGAETVQAQETVVEKSEVVSDDASRCTIL